MACRKVINNQGTCVMSAKYLTITIIEPDCYTYANMVFPDPAAIYNIHKSVTALTIN